MLDLNHSSPIIISHINEDRRKTEGQVQMFELLKEIEECPVSKLLANVGIAARLDWTI